MKIKKNVKMVLSEDEVCKIIAQHLTNTTDYRVKPEDVQFNLKNNPDEFGGQPTPEIRDCEINVEV